MLLSNKIRRALKRHPTRRTFFVWVDPIASSYKKADEAVEVIAKRIVAKTAAGNPPEIRVTTRESHDVRAIQLCDLLLGAVMRHGKTRPSRRASLRSWVISPPI
jgi:hypothetical protein